MTTYIIVTEDERDTNVYGAKVGRAVGRDEGDGVGAGNGYEVGRAVGRVEGEGVGAGDGRESPLVKTYNST